jgi:hypothetical protein
MEKNTEPRKKHHSPLPFVAIAALMVFSLFATIYASTNLVLPGKPVDRVTPSIESAGPESYFEVEIAYAYAGSLQSDKTSYVDPITNETMVHASKYPSAVFLDFTAIPAMTSSCDAVIAAYGVKIIADTGPTEYYGWSAGTADYNVFTQDDFATLTSYRGELIYNSIYRSRGGTFSYNWTADRTFLSHTIGSVGMYRTNSTFAQQNRFDLSSAGTPNSISVEVYRVGYITMTNGSVTIHKDTVTDNKPIASAQLSTYEGGFIYNNIVPTEQLPQIDLFHPTR